MLLAEPGFEGAAEGRAVHGRPRQPPGLGLPAQVGADPGQACHHRILRQQWQSVAAACKHVCASMCYIWSWRPDGKCP